MNKTKLAMLLFVASEAVFFILLIITYVIYHATSPSAAEASRYLDIPRTAVFTACLIISSFTLRHAGIHFGTANRGWALAWLLATMAMGTAFLVGQGVEYLALIREHVTISRDLFGTTFFTLTGFHGLHVLIGLILLGALFGLERKRSVPGPSPAVECVSIYWHFVDAVWLIIFPVVYLWVLR
jgi:heme/copper-type cytochrome/quinol oxidase subunit 3